MRALLALDGGAGVGNISSIASVNGFTRVSTATVEITFMPRRKYAGRLLSPSRFGAVMSPNSTASRLPACGALRWLRNSRNSAHVQTSFRSSSRWRVYAGAYNGRGKVSYATPRTRA